MGISKMLGDKQNQKNFSRIIASKLRQVEIGESYKGQILIWTWNSTLNLAALKFEPPFENEGDMDTDR